MIRAVATDVDGTITNYKDELYLEAIVAIRNLEKAGIPVILCSGNSLCVLKGLARYIGCTGPTVSENGAVVEYKAGIRILGRKGISRQVVDELKRVYGQNVTESWSNRFRFVDMAIRRTIEFEKVQEVVKKFDGVKVIDSNFAYHITDRNVDKGKGLMRALKFLGIGPEEVAGIGDSITDLELLGVCGFKAAVANADPRLKEIADFVSEKEFGLGFAEIVERILSMKRSK
ncbi:MAG: phosphoglycolate phosphatase [Candidatus Methanomethyliaceae archaeon]|nr:phosphoglycolate phosphatase [Candidatus Methanomethyliaceae archaeon]